MCELVVSNCKVCSNYRAEEIGDSDFGGIFAEEQTCSEYLDTDENEELIADFDRDIERDCCKLEFFLVVDKDEELAKMFDEELKECGDDTFNFDLTYARFKEKYLKGRQ